MSHHLFAAAANAAPFGSENLLSIDVLAESAAAAEKSGVDQFLDKVFAPFAQVLSDIVFFALPLPGGAELPLIVVWLMAAAIFLTVYLRFQPITGLTHSLEVIRGKLTRKTDPGEVSSFQALATELSGTVGLGNIAGVAVAISVGGPGAALWIILFGFLAMSVKMAEATLGVKYRVVREDGSTAGGPMYYLKAGLAEIGRPKLGKFLSTFYAIAALIGVFGAGNLFQANQGAAVLVNATGGESSWFADKLWLIGVIMAVLAGLVIIGGIKKIADYTSAITPLMAILYMIGAVAVILVNFTSIPTAFGEMFAGAFTGGGVAGGVVGVAIIGIQRALFSNAAGVGSAGMAHSAVKTSRPATEGYTAMWEPLVDSVIVCTLTALAIITTGLYKQENDGSDAAGVELTSSAFSTVASWFPVLLTICVVLFAFSTVLSYSYYGQKATDFLTGGSEVAQRVFQVVWILAIVVGASIGLESVVMFSDAMFFLMSVPNLLGIYFLAKVLRQEILHHKVRADTGTLPEIPEDLQVGLRDHEPTQEQVSSEAKRIAADEAREDRVRQAFHEKTEERARGRRMWKRGRKD
ncbi:amino acid carrier protein [Brevibacterium sp. ACRRH]|uniref:alanine/glycine:cation symporter family protein n=1 Tax=Brevibacterium sp. ACRRH TaxID=2918183 RepID=UPI001EF628A5|nr:amino acid carrier protein [Brevibacterium sp. ACRRH]MCG7297889.1 amino acid carrier protein [Brevibacterium sp. ACRRH]